MFKSTTESEITNAIVSNFAEDMKQFANTDVIIVGGGPSGLMAARELSSNGVKTLIVERNNYLGGGFWIGGYLMNTITVRKPGQEILEELNIPYGQFNENLYTACGPHACSKLIAAVCDASLIGKIFREKGRVLDLDKYQHFYNGKRASREEVIEHLKKSTSVNLVGDESVAIAIELGLVNKDQVLYIQNIPLVQIYKV